jgi:A/G-specific adenine glycosylase
MSSFSQILLNWFDCHGRKNLPWQAPGEPYKVWLSEVMLQQTQVKTVIPYYERFIQRFPNLIDLANASEDEVLSLWSGLGYYSRARNLHKSAKIICSEWNGVFPQSQEALEQLPGIGTSTAAAIISQAYDRPAAILDGNVKRVLSRYFKVSGEPQKKATEKKLWEFANQCLPKSRFANYTQAIMDLGATLCTIRTPDCQHCPLKSCCQAYKDNVVADYPNKKNKKERPSKTAQLLLIYSEKNEVLLEKRPAKGIWGGLWSLPDLSASQCPNEFINKNYQTNAVALKELIRFKHSFTHFHLNIIAKTALINPKLAKLKAEQKWYTLEDMAHLGIPTAINKILQHWAQ